MPKIEANNQYLKNANFGGYASCTKNGRMGLRLSGEKNRPTTG